MRSKIAGHSGAVLVFAEGTTQAYGPPMVDIMRNGAIEAAFEAGKLVQPVRYGWACFRLRLCSPLWFWLGFGLGAAQACGVGAAQRLLSLAQTYALLHALRHVCPAAQAALYYSARVGLGWELEANGIRQTSALCAAPMIAAVQLCPTLKPSDFKSGEDMASAAKQALTDAYAAMEARYKAWPLERAPAEQ